MKNILLLAALLVSCFQLSAQQDRFQWRGGVHSGIMTYYGDLSNQLVDPNDQLLNIFDHTDYIAYGFSLEKNISKSWGMRLLYSRGQFIATDRQIDWQGDLLTGQSKFARALNVKTDLSDLSILGSYYFDNDKILKKTAFVAPYFSLGIGWSDFKTAADLFHADGSRYHYWSDGTIRDVAESSGVGAKIVELDGKFETKLRNLQTEGKSYSDKLFHGTLGLGFKFRISSRINLNLETLVRYTNTDFLDDVSGQYLTDYENSLQQYAAVPGTQSGDYRGNKDGINDFYAFTSLSIHYNFARKPTAFKAPVIRVGYLNNSRIEQDVVEQLIENAIDTQALYVATVEIDSVYYAQDLEALVPEAAVDTIMKIGDQIYTVNEAQQWTKADMQWESIWDQFYREELLQDSIDAMIDVPIDTQVLYVVSVPVDSSFIVVEITADIVDKMTVDTFYQQGKEFYSSEAFGPIEEEDWEVIWDQHLNPANTVDLELGYEEYMSLQAEMEDDAEITSAENALIEVPVMDTVANENIEIAAAQESLPIQIISPPSQNPADSLAKKMDALSAEINTLKSQEKNIATDEQKQGLELIQKQLDSLRFYQLALINELNEAKSKNALSVDLPAEGASKSDDKEKALISNNDNAPTASPNSIELEKLQQEVLRLQELATQKNDPELEQLKKQLLMYEIKQQNAEQNKAAFDALNAEIELLKNNKATPLKGQNPQVVVVPTNNRPSQTVKQDTSINMEVSQLRADMANMNQSLELMKQLLVEQQATALPSTTPIADSEKEKELRDLKQQVTELKLAMVDSNIAATDEPVNKENEAVKALQKQVRLLQEQLSVMSQKEEVLIVPTPSPMVTEAPPVDVRRLIRGRDQQLVFFSTGSAVLSSSALNDLQEIAQLLLQYEVLDVVLEAYTDASGDAQKNLLLSKKRAEAVKTNLLQYGISSTRIIMDYRGEDLQSNAAYGRRVEVKLRVSE